MLEEQREQLTAVIIASTMEMESLRGKLEAVVVVLMKMMEEEEKIKKFNEEVTE
jgi:hypothetical protein